MMHLKECPELKSKLLLCVNCHNCKTKQGETYCIKGYFREDNSDKPIIYTPLDFECYFFELA